MLTPLAMILVALGGCASSADPPEDSPADPTGDTSPEPVPFELSSGVFEAGDTIPLPYECGAPFSPTGPGENLSPPLSWTPGPEGTRSYAIVMRDKDFRPAGYEDGLIHWAIYDIPADVDALPEGIDEGPTVDDPSGAKQTEMQGSGLFGYFGPCSPSSVNTYRFTIYALPDETLSLDGDTSEIHVAEVVEALALDKDSLAGES